MEYRACVSVDVRASKSAVKEKKSKRVLYTFVVIRSKRFSFFAYVVICTRTHNMHALLFIASRLHST